MNIDDNLSPKFSAVNETYPELGTVGQIMPKFLAAADGLNGPSFGAGMDNTMSNDLG